MGFFPASEAVSKPAPGLLAKCGVCGLDKRCRSPKMPYTGFGQRGILIVGEAPGDDEDLQGVPFVGRAGQLLKETLLEYGVDFDRDCWKTNANICRPENNRTPTAAEIDYCRPNLNKTIRELNPRMILPLGPAAVRSLLGPLWRENVGSMTQWAGWRIPLQPGNRWVCPNYHPAHVLNCADDPNGPVVRLWFKKYLERALLERDRPWGVVPDFDSMVRIELDPHAAAVWIDQRLAAGGVFSFDYETNMLKPDSGKARIVCCSICHNGQETIAFPWVGPVIDAMRRFVASQYPKIGANNKFEDRWTRAKLGVPVENFVWDCVLDAHILDNRELITSVKFQAFVRLGFSPWNDAVEPFLAASPDIGNAENRIHEVKLETLLKYCGLDALVEFLIAKDQKNEYKTFTF